MTSLPPYNEKELLQRIAGGSEEAFRQLFDEYRRRLFTYVYKITESRETSEDTVQEIFLTLWAKRTTLTSIDNISAYLYRMAHNNAYHGFRKLAKETLLIDHLKKEQSGAAGPMPEQQLISKEVQAYVQSLVDQLTPQQRKVFLLSRENGLKQEEIARELGVSISTVKKHMVDALHFLRDEINKNYGSQAVAIFVVYQLSAI